MLDKNFLITFDGDTGDKLLSLGFEEIYSPSVEARIFLNNAKIILTNSIDMSKITYSNMLFC